MSMHMILCRKEKFLLVGRLVFLCLYIVTVIDDEYNFSVDYIRDEGLME